MVTQQAADPEWHKRLTRFFSRFWKGIWFLTGSGCFDGLVADVLCPCSIFYVFIGWRDLYPQSTVFALDQCGWLAMFILNVYAA